MPSPERSNWPYNAWVDLGDGRRAFFGSARANPDGTVTVVSFEPPEGFVEKTFPGTSTRLAVAPDFLGQQWLSLYRAVYGQLPESED